MDTDAGDTTGGTEMAQWMFQKYVKPHMEWASNKLMEWWEYGKYGVPIIGDIYRASGEREYWNDYKRVTGQKVRYPAMTYNRQGEARMALRYASKIPRWLK